MDNSFCDKCGRLLRPDEGRSVWVDVGLAIIACDSCGSAIYEARIEKAKNAVFGPKNRTKQQTERQKTDTLF